MQTQALTRRPSWWRQMAGPLAWPGWDRIAVAPRDAPGVPVRLTGTAGPLRVKGQGAGQALSI